MVLLDCIIIQFLIFWGISILFSTVAVPDTLSPTMHKTSLFSTSLPIFVISCLFDNSHSDRCGALSSCGFDFYFPDDQWCWASFHVSIGHLYVFSGKMFRYLAHFLIRLFIYFCYWVVWVFLNIFLILTPYWVCNLQIFSPIWLSFHFVKSFLCCAETFSLMQFIFALGAKKNHCHVWYQRVWHLCFLLGVCGIRCYIQVFNPFWINF